MYIKVLCLKMWVLEVLLFTNTSFKIAVKVSCLENVSYKIIVIRVVYLV